MLWTTSQGYATLCDQSGMPFSFLCDFKDLSPTVQPVCLCPQEKVAIKKIQNVFEHVSDATRILREIKLLRMLKHPGRCRASTGPSFSP